jgi:hypothetical protein
LLCNSCNECFGALFKNCSKAFTLFKISQVCSSVE